MADAQPLRLYVTASLGEGTVITLEREQSHYLINVMRRTEGAPVDVFNGRDGEWRAYISAADKKATELSLDAQSRPQTETPDVWLLFAPLKKDRTDFVIEKATELGVSKILPVITEHTQTGRVNVERLSATALEAAEQSRRLSVPEIMDATALDMVLDNWSAERTLIFLDETGGGQPIARSLSGIDRPLAFLIGPEGGFSPAELDRLGKLPFSVAADLGPRILRAETAAVAALAVRQSIFET